MSVFGLSQNPGRTSPPLDQSYNQSAQEQFDLRRENFTNGRQLLLEKGVPFDPDELLRDGWSKKLRGALDTMQEMHESRYETKPLKGAYFADTLYLPEKTQLTGHTVIVANYVVFEGKEPIIRGNYDLHFFPAGPVGVLGTTLSQALQKKGALLNVKFGSRPVLPSFSLIQDLADRGKHKITLDTSGPEPQKKQIRPAGTSLASLRGISWAGLNPAVLQSQDTSGQTGSTGSTGGPGGPGVDTPTAASGHDGTCSVPGLSNTGTDAFSGLSGGKGGKGGTGGTGGRGFDAGVINANIADGDFNEYSFKANGGTGGTGGEGGPGGQGGKGGNGGNGGNGVACGCNVGAGGNAGAGGNGNRGGDGGDGGLGGLGGDGKAITVSLPAGSPGATASNSAGHAGIGGGGGGGATGGPMGIAGTPGTGATACGQTAPNGASQPDGGVGDGGNGGSPGPLGDPGQDGPPPSITFRQPPGGGGGGDNPCPPSDDPYVVPVCSPIIIDTEGEGFHLTSAAGGVTFDIRGDGHSRQIAWTAPGSHNAFLALPGADGVVHNGTQLFGNFTKQPASPHPNGFLALAEFDKPENGGNGDGVIDERDAVFSRLRLWIDENHDGISQPFELHTLPELGIYSLSLDYFESRRTDEFGNQFRYKARVNPGEHRDPRDQTPSGIPGRWAYDVFLVIQQ
jgi:hypothetical protein